MEGKNGHLNVSKEEIKEFATKYAKENESIFTNDYFGFKAGFEKAKELIEDNVILIH